MRRIHTMKTKMWSRKMLVAVLLLACAEFGFAKSKAAWASPQWVGSWATSQQIPEPANSLNNDDLRDATLRQIVHLSIGGGTLRVHVTNAFGPTPLSLTSVHIARPVST